MTDPTPCIFVVDDDPSVRDALQLLFESVGHQVVTFGSASQFLEWDHPPPPLGGPACLVLDVKMPGISGLDLQQALAAKSPSLPIIFITGHGDIPMSVQAMKKGAVDFLTKPFEDDQLLGAVEEALKKSSQFCDAIKLSKELQRKLDSLTAREQEILTYLITGMLNKQIAYQLDIAERTVKAHRKQVFNKMGVASIAELVRLTEKLGIKPAQALP